jgi:hypothetical protein
MPYTDIPPAPKHTPGPWRIRWLTNGWPVITSDAHDIADLRLNGNGLPHVEANARLIAAAPELLEAAIAVRHYLPMDCEEAMMLRAAIAEATGRA